MKMKSTACITKCTATQETFVHPYYFALMKNNPQDKQCGIFEWEHNIESKQIHMRNIRSMAHERENKLIYSATSDKLVDDTLDSAEVQQTNKILNCEKNMENNINSNNETEWMLLRREVVTPKMLLTYIYHLNTFEEVIKWTTENEKLPFNTILRVHDCAWKVYGISTESNLVIDFYYDLFMEHWIKDFILVIQSIYSIEVFKEKNKEYKHDDISYFYTILTESIMTYGDFARCVEHISNKTKYGIFDSPYYMLKQHILDNIISKLNKIPETKKTQ